MLINAPIRGNDKHGSGAFGAPRGRRKHKGIDVACYKGSEVLSNSDGMVTKIGFPYSQGNPDPRTASKAQKKFLLKKALRYIQVSDGDFDFRYFYIIPLVNPGDKIKKGEPIGITAGLLDIYSGITDHFHFEIKENGKIINPELFI